MDPFEKPYWTIRQTLSWICYRKPEFVRELDPDYRVDTDRENDESEAEPRKDSKPREYSHYLDGFLEAPVFPPDARNDEEYLERIAANPATVEGSAHLLFAGRFAKRRMSDREAHDQLVFHAQQGELVATGIRGGDGDPEQMPKLSWRNVRIYTTKGNQEIVGPERIESRDGTRWFDVRFESSALKELWPTDDESIEEITPPAETSSGKSVSLKQVTREPDSPLSEEDAKLKNRIESVVARANREWTNPKKRPGFEEMARRLTNKNKKALHEFKKAAVGKILRGT